MCGRFVNLTKINNIKKNFDIRSSIDINLISYNISPSQNCIIVFKEKEINLDIAKWGYSFLDKAINLRKNVINSRLETIRDKIIFKESYNKRKCVIPINGYYEWSLKDRIKTPFFIHISPHEPMFLAGIWKYIDFKKDNNKSFTIITKKANHNLDIIHTRMPVLLSFEEANKYLDDDNSNFLKNNFLSIIESDLDFYPVSKFLNNPLNNSKECIEKFK